MQSAATSPRAEQNPSRASPYLSAGERELVQSAADWVEEDQVQAIVDRVLERGRLLTLDGPSLRTKTP